MTFDEKYTLLMTAARDRYRAGDWPICLDYLRDARKLACERELKRGATWADRRRWANACMLALESLMVSCGLEA